MCVNDHDSQYLLHQTETLYRAEECKRITVALNHAHLHVLESLLHVALEIAGVVDKLCLEQTTQERNLVQHVHLTDLLGRFCATDLNAGVHRYSHNSLVDKEMDELVPVE